jgi:hypothetical protein
MLAWASVLSFERLQAVLHTACGQRSQLVVAREYERARATGESTMSRMATRSTSQTG